jgi:hypothetical protein
MEEEDPKQSPLIWYFLIRAVHAFLDEVRTSLDEPNPSIIGCVETNMSIIYIYIYIYIYINLYMCVCGERLYMTYSENPHVSCTILTNPNLTDTRMIAEASSLIRMRPIF